MKQLVLLAVIAIVAAGAGFAGGIMMANSKNKVIIADMQAKMQKSETESQERIRGYDAIVSRLNGELQLAKMEIEALKTPAPAAEELPIPAIGNENASAVSADSSVSGDAKSYTIQNGDSLWSIAQKQLGNGSRFKEILKLNPKISAKGNLVVGSKLNIPAK